MSAEPPPPPRRPASMPRRAAGQRGPLTLIGRSLLAVIGVLFVLVVLSVPSAIIALHHESGTRWLLAQLPWIHASGMRGALFGDFDAQTLSLTQPGGGQMVWNDVRWRGLRIGTSDHTAVWLRITVDTLSAARVTINGMSSTPSPSAAPSSPSSLHLPFELSIAQLRIDELNARSLGAAPLRHVQAAVHLGAAGGMQHRVDRLKAEGHGIRLAGDAVMRAVQPFTVNVSVTLMPLGEDSTVQWNAGLRLDGPLSELVLQAGLRSRAVHQKAEQSLDATATLRPFAAWPIAQLEARTKLLNLAALQASWPVTALTGTAVVTSSAADQPATVRLALRNEDASRWSEGRLPVRSLTAELSGRPDTPNSLNLQTFDVALGTRRDDAGRWTGSGRRTASRTASHWQLDTTLRRVTPSLLDARAPRMSLDGPLRFSGELPTRGLREEPSLRVTADIAGQMAGRGPARIHQFKLDASLRPSQIEVRDLRLMADGAQAHLAGTATRNNAADAPWLIKARAALADFDPAPWWPGAEDSPWRRGSHRLNAKATVDLRLPARTASATSLASSAWPRGSAELTLANSQLAGINIRGEATLRSANDAPGHVDAKLMLDAAGNTVRGEGRFTPTGSGTADRWLAELAAPDLQSLAPLWRLLRPEDKRFSGSAHLMAQGRGRWPDVVTDGNLSIADMRAGPLGVSKAQARWNIDLSRDGPMQVEAMLAEVSLLDGPMPTAVHRTLEAARLTVDGNTREHRIELTASTRALPPAWTETLAPSTAASAANDAPRTLATVSVQGSATTAAGQRRLSGWRGSIRQLELRSNDPGAAPWVRARGVALETEWGAAPALVMQPGRADVLGGGITWSRVAWRGASATSPAFIEAQAEIEPLLLGPVLARAQPDFGWGGDLAVAGHVRLRSAPSFAADVVLQRTRGDLTVTDESGTQPLGLTDLRFGLDVNDGVWSFTQALAGTTLGVAAGAIVVRSTPDVLWPPADAPIQGVLELQVANLGTWGTWVPAGWRLAGALRTSASISGRFGAPQYTGSIRGTGLAVRNFLQGVSISDGEVAASLDGTTATIEKFEIKAGAGVARIEGGASLGEQPRAQLKLTAERFQVLGRIDRRVVASGQAQLQLDAERLALDGHFAIDEGLIDVTRSDAPTLASDVDVMRRARPAPAVDEATRTATPSPSRKTMLDVKVDLGQQLRLRGRGLDAGLRGNLHVTSPEGRLTVVGNVNAVEGTYAAYRQKLTIDRGLLAFNGAIDNPRLDIEATRADTDVRVGVIVTGNAVDPRIRLFSDPDVSDTEKLSWLMLGRGIDGLGSNDMALLQRAALALLAGEGEGTSEQLTKAIGLDQFAVRQTEGDVRETVISLGKQLSRRWYVGYERGLNATAGSWQLIYRVAQRFTLRAQSGLDNSLDAIWTWRWQ